MKFQTNECPQHFDIFSHPYGFIYTTALTTTGILVADIATRLFCHATGFKINPRFFLSEKLSQNLDTIMFGFRFFESKIAYAVTLGIAAPITLEFFEHALIAPIAEELLFRSLIQNTVLLSLPQSLGINGLDSSYYSIFRIMTSASLFAIAHMNYWDGKEGIIPEFTSGIIFGVAKEYFGIGTSITSHMLINARNVAQEMDQVV